MWALLLLFAILLPILLLSIAIVAVAAAIALVRRRGNGARVEFTGLVFAYAGLMILIGVFVLASGAGLIAKAALGEGVSQDFSYDRASFSSSNTVDDAVREDVVYGVTLVLLGAVMLAPHAAGAYALRERGAPGGITVSRGFNLIGLATATIGFLAAGGTALALALERAADQSAQGWHDYHPGEPLAFAVILGVLSAWFAYRLWGDAIRSIDATSAPPQSATG